MFALLLDFAAAADVELFVFVFADDDDDDDLKREKNDDVSNK